MEQFSACREGLEDPRTGNAALHGLHGLLMIALCTVLSGGETAKDMAVCLQRLGVCRAGGAQWIIACMPERAQDDVWGGDGTALAASSLAPRETARRETGRMLLGLPPAAGEA